MTFDHGPTAPRSIAITPNGGTVVSAECEEVKVDYRIDFENHGIKIWDLASGQCLNALRGHTDIIKTVVITPDGQKILSGSIDYTLRIWDLETGACLRTITDPGTIFEAIAVTTDGKRIVSSSLDSSIKLWDGETGECLKMWMGQLDLDLDLDSDLRWKGS